MLPDQKRAVGLGLMSLPKISSVNSKSDIHLPTEVIKTSTFSLIGKYNEIFGMAFGGMLSK